VGRLFRCCCLDRRFTHGFQLAASYTWSKFIDSTSEGVGYMNQQQPDKMNRTSVPVMQGGLKLHHGVSDFDRPQRLSIVYLWAVPGLRLGWLRYPLGGKRTRRRRRGSSFRSVCRRLGLASIRTLEEA
jgi:hypothetical protein